MKKRIFSILTSLIMAVSLFGVVPTASAAASLKVTQVSLGWDHSAAITEDGSLYMWGHNSYGELGTETDEMNYDGYPISTKPIKIMENVKSVSLGNSHSAAITEDGSLYMWGHNSDGELGNGTTTESSVPIKIMDNVKSVSLGSGHSAAITEDGSLYMWGDNYHGELGNGTTSVYNANSSPIKIMENVKSVSLGVGFSAAITEDGSLYMWGHNSDGELGNGTTTESSVPIKIMDNVKSVSLGNSHSAVIKEDGSLWMWGYNSDGRLGNGTTTNSYVPIKIMDNVKSVSLGWEHSAAITEDGSLYMWGGNYFGELGNGTTSGYNANSSPIKIMENVKSVSLGQFHSAVIKEDGSLYMWGYNYSGQLGNGTTTNSSVPIKVTISGTQTGSSIKTSTGYRYPYKYLLTKFAYPNMRKYLNNDSTAVPGLELTNVSGNGCGNMVPQGCCAADDYILITAYCYDNKHNSVIYVLDKDTGDYLTTLVLSDVNHVGGITFDGTYVWIAKSTKKSLSAISLSNIKSAVNKGNDSVSINYDKTLSCGMKASYVTYNKTDNTYWVGFNHKSETNYLREFKYENNKLVQTGNKINLNVKNTNGAVFAQSGGATYLIVNVSPGRHSASLSYVYKVTDLENDKISSVSSRKLPPMAEEICIDGSKVYTVFESASTPYSTKINKCNFPVDRVCSGNLKNFLGIGGSSKTTGRSLSRSYTQTDEDGNTYEYDDNGNLIYYEDTDGFWYRSAYDENGNEISCEYSDGYVDNNTYDSGGNMLSSVCTGSDGTWVKASYSNGGNISFYEDSNNYWFKSAFDENENEIYYEDSENYSYEQTFDELGNVIYYVDNEGFRYKAEYDEDCNQTYYENSDGYWIKTTYDEDGNVVSSTEGNKTTEPTAKPVIKPTTKAIVKPTATAAKTTSVAQAKSAAQKAMKQAKIKKLTAKSKGKKINVTWKKVKKAKGYQVQVSPKKNFKKLVYKKFTSKNKLTIKNKKIKRGKKYFVRVRAYAIYKDKNGKSVKVYGAWNKKLRKVKVK